MKTTDNRREARSRANRRLRNLTIGTAVFGVVATGGLTALAAATTSGGATPSTVTASTTATTSPPTTTTTTAGAPVVSAASGPGVATTGGS